MSPAAKVCAAPGCPELQPCPRHARKAWQGSNRRAELPRGWSSRIVPRILKRDPVCTICGQQPSTDAHHTGDPHDHRLESLAGVCRDCHKRETAQQAAAARRLNA